MNVRPNDLPFTKMIFCLVAAFILVLFSCCKDAGNSSKPYKAWEVTGGSKENIKYADLNQIDTQNVKDLEVAWIYHSEGADSLKFSPIETNPIIVDNVLYGVSPKMKLFALVAGTGKQIWVFDPRDSLITGKWVRNSENMNRGVTYWSSATDKRIIYTVGPFVYAVDALSGSLIKSFGDQGGIDLRKGLGRDEKKSNMTPTSPVIVYKDLFIVSGQVDEETPGHIRAFDVKTGEQKWIFHTIPHPGEFGFDTWEDSTAYKTKGSANAWSGFSLDEKRGLVFAGIGNPTNDFYGGKRLGDGLFGNCILALDAETGKRKWHFQTVRHDVWDMDPSSAPILVTLNKGGQKIDALVQTTKTGLVFILDRETGTPIYPIEERPVPTFGAVEGEVLSPTQPFPVKPAPFARQGMTEKDLNSLVSADSYEDIKKRYAQYNSHGIYTPPSINGTVIFPGYDGGGEWGGPSFDPETGILYVNSNEMTWVLNLVKLEKTSNTQKTNLEAGAILYKKHCMSCHGPERLGGGDYPSLIAVNKKYNLIKFNELLSTGRRMMPPFNHMSLAEKNAIASLILELDGKKEELYAGKPETLATSSNEDNDSPDYSFTGYNKFLTKEGYPAVNPPWGTLNAIDLNTGEYVWKIPFGEFEELKKKGIPTTGRENYGGSVITSGGLLFIAASSDGKFRAINKANGKILFETELPAPGVATPATYVVNGKQFVVIACGGSKWGGKKGDAYVAFALPDKK